MASTTNFVAQAGYNDANAGGSALQPRQIIDRQDMLKPNLEDRSLYEFAASFASQLREVQLRVFQQIWRSPTYIYSKIVLCAASALFVGFSLYQKPNRIQGLQNQKFSIFMLLTLFRQFIQLIMPQFVVQRNLYEARERPSKTYSWQVFMVSKIIVELPWNALVSFPLFAC